MGGWAAVAVVAGGLGYDRTRASQREGSMEKQTVEYEGGRRF